MSSMLPSGFESSTYSTAVLSSQVPLFVTLTGAESGAGAPGTGKATLLNTLLHGTVVPTTRNRDANGFEVATYRGTQQEGNVTLDVEISEILGYGSDRLVDKTYPMQIVELLKRRHQICHHTERDKVESIVPQTTNLIHAVLYFVPPTFMQFSASEIALFKDLQQLTLVVPVISKADIYTAGELKDKKLLARWPLAVIGSTERHELNGGLVRARVYPWGVIDIDNDEYSDLLHLQRLLISSFFVIGHEYVRQELYEKLWRPWFMSTNLDETLSKVSDEMPKIRELSTRGSITTTPITASHDVLPKMVHSPSAISTTLVKEKTYFFESRQSSMSN